MHCAEDVGDDQSTSTRVSIELDVLAFRCGSDTVKSNRTLNSGVDAFDGDSYNAPLVV